MATKAKSNDYDDSGGCLLGSNWLAYVMAIVLVIVIVICVMAGCAHFHQPECVTTRMTGTLAQFASNSVKAIR